MRRPWIRTSSLALAAGLALGLGGCSGSSSPTSASASTTSGSSVEASAAWDDIDRSLQDVGPEVSFLAAEVGPDGTCHPVHQLDATTRRPIGSQFKLHVLGALTEQVATGDVSWDQELTIDEASKSIGNGEGSLQVMPAGTTVTVAEAASRMIAISDNTAADVLLELVGRDAVEQQSEQWMDDPSPNVPFLNTRQMFLLHYVPGLADQYLDLAPAERAEFLATKVDPRPLSDIGAGLTKEPSYVEEIEWFASADEVCRSFAGLHDLASEPAGRPLDEIMSGDVRGLDLPESDWPTIWYKGGSESGVLTLGWLATDDEGRTFVVEAMVTNPDDPLPDDAIEQIVPLAERAFAELRSS